MEQFRLTVNVRAARTQHPGSKLFAAQLLRMGNDGWPKNEDGTVTFPPNFGIQVRDIDALVATIYPNLAADSRDFQLLSGRSILTT